MTRTGPRGNLIVVKPARLALARVSCIRGNGPRSGTPFIDSYVQQAEPVVDYLTRFSGILPGDLDPSVSRHHIESMKAAYVKLRQLSEAGVRFVGHGLKKDFEIINIVLPPEQILDTVDLFYVPGCRRLSLRFLAFHLLGLQARFLIPYVNHPLFPPFTSFRILIHHGQLHLADVHAYARHA